MNDIIKSGAGLVCVHSSEAKYEFWIKEISTDEILEFHRQNSTRYAQYIFVWHFVYLYFLGDHYGQQY